MRILAIRGRNLASLARTFEVDLAHGMLGGVGLFAITGPVGAGKSTLLDALCLALFDRTPRLSGRGGVLVGDDSEARGDWLRSSDPRSLLRRDAAEGHAEVDFTGRDGVRYRARWAVRRARRRSDGRVQDQEMSLVDLDRGAIAAGGRKTEVLAAIEARLGLDFSQFCRSVLLAQGEFAAFLRASADERARLLENLTGADIYRRLSRAAHERRRQGDAQVQLLRAQVEVQAPLEDPARRVLERHEQRLAQEHEVCKVGIDLASRYVTWYEAAERHRQNESEATVALQQSIEADARAAPRRERLARLQRALPVVARWEVAEQQRQVAERECLAAAAAAAARGEHAAAAQRSADVLLAELRRAFAGGAQQVSAVPPLVRDLPQWEPLLLQWQRAEARATQLVARLPGLLAGVDTAAARLERARVAAATAEQERERTAAAVEAARRATQTPDLLGLAEVRSQLAVRRSAVTRLRELGEQWQRAVAQREAMAARGDALAAEGPRLTAAADDSTRQLVLVAEHLGAARRSATRQRTHHDLAALRGELVAGEPCPLCGATDHPAAGGAEDSDPAAAERVLALAERRHDEAQRLAAAAVAARASWEREQIAARHAADGASKAELAASAAFRHGVRADAEALAASAAEAALQVARRRLAAVDADELDLQQREAKAGSAASAFHASVQASAGAEQVARDMREQVASARQLHLDTVALADAARAEGERLSLAVTDLQAALVPACEGLPGGAAAVQRLGAQRAVDLRSLHRRHREQESAAAAATAAAERGAAAEAAAARAGIEHAAAQRALARALDIAKVGEQDVAAAVEMGIDAMPVEARELQALADEVTAARAVLRERAAQRREHEGRDRPELDAADAALALEQARQARAEVEKRRVDVQGQLRADDAVRRQRAEIAPRLEQAERKLAVWQALDDLIGSSGGDAFVVFAQSLTLDLLLAEANRRLAELARRYRLQKNPGGEMDFVVVDLDLGGTRRGLQSLSGGETFLVSLALALALATLAAPRSRVETLFLDEGFGTLDAQNLESALGALDTLQATGCQIGVISHVDGIAERIGAIVEVQPEGGGQSRVRARLA